MILIRGGEGGVNRVVNSIKPLLEKKGHKIDVISREDDLNRYSLISSFRVLRKEVKRRDYDLIYTQDWSCALPFLFKKNHYCCFHGHNFGVGFFIQSLIGKIMGKRLIVVGPTLKKRFPKSNLIYNGASKKDFYDMKKKRKYIGYYFSNRKMNASDPIAKETLDKVKELKEKFKLETSLAKDIPPNKMNEWYNSLQFFICLPPKQTGFILGWLEAKFAGVPNIIGNEYGVGISNLNANWKSMTWENHVNKLLETFNRKNE